MNARLSIDGIVRQTTVLIAQLSTAAGVRAPLAHVADQVFLELPGAREGDRRTGIGRKVVADMFGERTEPELAAHLNVGDDVIARAVATLLGDGRLSRGGDAKLLAENVVIPVGATDGWEAAVLDHYRAMATAIAFEAQGGAAHNPEHPVPESATRVLFYFGQLITEGEAEGGG
jgi:hypothetical protein